MVADVVGKLVVHTTPCIVVKLSGAGSGRYLRCDQFDTFDTTGFWEGLVRARE